MELQDELRAAGCGQALCLENIGWSRALSAAGGAGVGEGLPAAASRSPALLDGGGSFSLLRVINEAYKVEQL
ncbi:MAG: hypothetical protein OXU96_11185, partial [Gammaproteobacteria bacterium]|nr:hypothetical protein [Gammaproteobacteria bacterium]MDD9874445.1 hypothetical protein [Gammaproteobacteria bacterium]